MAAGGQNRRRKGGRIDVAVEPPDRRRAVRTHRVHAPAALAPIAVTVGYAAELR